MGFFSSLFGSDTVVNKAVDGVYNGIDSIVYTDQEKAENENKKSNLKIQLLKAYEPFKIAQRVIAFMIGTPFVFIHLITFFIWIGSILLITDSARYDFIFEQLKLIGDWNNSTLGEPFTYVIGFYFFGGAAEGIVRARNEKK